MKQLSVNETTHEMDMFMNIENEVIHGEKIDVGIILGRCK